MLTKQALWGAHRVKFRVVSAKVRGEVERGVPVKQVWRAFEQAEIPGISYRQFLRYVEQMMGTGAHLPKGSRPAIEDNDWSVQPPPPPPPAQTSTDKPPVDAEARAKRMAEMMKDYYRDEPRMQPRIPDLDKLVGKGRQ